jgi:transcriptional regulator with XRE-family HTH domain
MTNLKLIGERIRIVRLTSKLSQKELAAKANLSVVTIGSIERGSANVSINNLSAIAEALNCQLTINLDLESGMDCIT